MERDFESTGEILSTFDPSRSHSQIFAKFEEACSLFKTAKLVTEKKVGGKIFFFSQFSSTILKAF